MIVIVTSLTTVNTRAQQKKQQDANEKLAAERWLKNANEELAKAVVYKKWQTLINHAPSVIRAEQESRVSRVA